MRNTCRRRTSRGWWRSVGCIPGRLYGAGLTCPIDCPMMAGSRGGLLIKPQARTKGKISGAACAFGLALAVVAGADTPARQAVVLNTVENMYSAPDPDKDVVSQALLGQLVSLLETRDAFARIETPDHYTGWVAAGGLFEYLDPKAPRYAARGPVAEVTSLMAN